VEKAPDFELPDERGRPWRLAEKLREGPVLLVFYRGDW
jgi:peroxiredoxin